MHLALEFVGEIVERQELLNGTESVTVDATSGDGEWTLNATVSWNLGILDFAGEGDVTLVRPDGRELYGTLIHARPARAEAVDWIIEARFDVDGGSAAWSGASGSITARFELRADVAAAALELNVRDIT